MVSYVLTRDHLPFTDNMFPGFHPYFEAERTSVVERPYGPAYVGPSYPILFGDGSDHLCPSLAT
jgi:hypothetical protein